MEIFNLQNASIGYSNNNKLLDNFNLSLESGKLYCLIGENGSGKSTLFKTMINQMPLLDGSQKLFEKNIESYSNREFAQKISIVFTGREALSTMKAQELINLGRQPYTSFLGNLKEEDCKKIEDAIKQVGVGDLLNENINELSDGEFQRVMLARVLAQDTPLVLLDEPTSYLDFNNKIKLMKLLKKLCEEGKTILFSSHDISLALKFADAILLIKNKEISLITTNDTQLKEQLIKLFPEAENYL